MWLDCLWLWYCYGGCYGGFQRTAVNCFQNETRYDVNMTQTIDLKHWFEIGWKFRVDRSPRPAITISTNVTLMGHVTKWMVVIGPD